MIQIIQKPHRLQSLANGISSGLAGLGQGYVPEREFQQKKKLSDLQATKKEAFFKNFADRFGQENADLFMELDPGAQTELLKNILDHEQRGNGLNKKAGLTEELPQYDRQQEEETEDDSLLDDMPTDRSVGLTSKEKVKLGEQRYSQNLDLHTADDKKFNDLRNESEDLKTLEELDASGKLPEFLGRFNVNPQTGTLVVPALGSPEAQLYVKTVQRRLEGIKSQLGSVISDNDIKNFLAQFSTLANSKGGRELINKHLRLFNQKGLFYHEELQKYKDKNGGIRNIDYDKAQSHARKAADKRYQAALSEIKKEEKSTKSQEVKSLKSKVPRGKVLAIRDGQYGYITPEQLKQAQKAGKDIKEVK